MINNKHAILTLIILIINSLSNVYSNSYNKPNSKSAPLKSNLRQEGNGRKKFGPIFKKNKIKLEHLISTTKHVSLKDENNQHGFKKELTNVTEVEYNEERLNVTVKDDPEDRKYPPPKISYKCNMKVNVKEHFEKMDKLDDRFAAVRNKYQKAVENDDFDKEMLTMMLKTRGAAERAIQSAGGDSGFIPAGINLGGYSMMRLPDSILFFHRLKLRNDTHFRVNYLHNDLNNMVLTANLSLNDLHILGAYERATTFNDQSELFFAPTYGEVEFLLRNVKYNMEGRYRLLREKLTIELVVSDISVVSDILMMYLNNNKINKFVSLQKENIDEFLDRLKTSLDKWLKDYFNDYLMYFALSGNIASTNFLKYDQEKTIALNEYADDVLERINRRLQNFKASAVTVPKFTITTVNGMTLKLTNGVLRGLNSIHRRSLATSKKEKKLRKVDTIVGFSSLKATYHYEAVLSTGVPPINGILIVSADELIAHMGITMIENSDTLDLLFDSIQLIKPESLTLEGPANRIIGNFKRLLEGQVFTFISNAIIHNVRMLRSITKCEPHLSAFLDAEENVFIQENESDSITKNQSNEESNSKLSDNDNAYKLVTAKTDDTDELQESSFNNEDIENKYISNDNDVFSKELKDAAIQQVDQTFEKTGESLEKNSELPSIEGDNLSEGQTAEQTLEEVYENNSEFPNMEGQNLSEDPTAEHTLEEVNEKNSDLPNIEGQKISEGQTAEHTLEEVNEKNNELPNIEGPNISEGQTAEHSLEELNENKSQN